jgi:hypothetical protein
MPKPPSAKTSEPRSGHDRRRHAGSVEDRIKVAMGAIGRKELEALADMIAHVDGGRRYCWRVTSMRKLVAADLAAPGTPMKGRAPCFVPTEIGREKVKELARYG